jgi:hypothetical protein
MRAKPSKLAARTGAGKSISFWLWDLRCTMRPGGRLIQNSRQKP